MIPKYRKRAVVRIAVGYAILFAAFIVFASTDRTTYKQAGEAIAIIVALVGFIVYSFGCCAWAEAKGYSTSVAVGLICVGFLCCAISTLVLPPIVLICLHDKTSGQRSRSRRSKWFSWIK